MKTIYSLLFSAIFSSAFSQQQLGNVYAGNNINAPAQMIQTNIFVNVANSKNVSNSDYNNVNDNNPLQQQQTNYVDNNVGNEEQTQQISNKAKQSNDDLSSGKGIDLSFDFSSRSSSSGFSSKKTNRHTFQKKLKKFNRNFYGKLASHKKSKHLVDVCFNWSK